MAYYLSKERDADVAGAYRRYQDYLRKNEHCFPTGAFALGTAEWWQNPDDHRSPQDALLETLTLFEPTAAERSEKKGTAVRIRLLGAYDDGFIELFYPDVFSCSFDGQNSASGIGDWRYDEFRLSADDRVIHEIEWSGGARWIIEAADIEYSWLPK